MKITVEMSIWDNTTCTAEKQDVLLYCEHAMLKTWGIWYNRPAAIKITTRWWGGFTAEIQWDGQQIDPLTFLRTYNRRLNRLHYWRRNDEPLVMEWNVTR